MDEQPSKRQTRERRRFLKLLATALIGTFFLDEYENGTATRYVELVSDEFRSSEDLRNIQSVIESLRHDAVPTSHRPYLGDVNSLPFPEFSAKTMNGVPPGFSGFWKTLAKERQANIRFIHITKDPTRNVTAIEEALKVFRVDMSRVFKGIQINAEYKALNPKRPLSKLLSIPNIKANELLDWMQTSYPEDKTEPYLTNYLIDVDLANEAGNHSLSGSSYLKRYGNLSLVEVPLTGQIVFKLSRTMRHETFHLFGGKHCFEDACVMTVDGSKPSAEKPHFFGPRCALWTSRLKRFEFNETMNQKDYHGKVIAKPVPDELNDEDFVKHLRLYLDKLYQLRSVNGLEGSVAMPASIYSFKRARYVKDYQRIRTRIGMDIDVSYFDYRNLANSTFIEKARLIHESY